MELDMPRSSAITAVHKLGIIRYQLTAAHIQSKDENVIESEIGNDDVIPAPVKWNVMRM
jgi:hypothetical protein